MLKAAVIGVGAMGRHHARVYNELDDEARLAAIADVDEGAAQKLGRRLKVPAYGDYHEMLDREAPDCVSVAVPTERHYPVACELIERGVHVLIEKPIAATLDEGRDLIARAARRGVQLGVGHVERFNCAVLALKRLLDEGALGEVYQLHGRRLSPFPAQVKDVGVVMDLATHELDIMRFLVGADVEYVFAELGRKIHVAHEDMLSCILHFANGAAGVLDINWLTPTKVRDLRVTGEKGMYVVDYLLQDLYYFENSYHPSEWDNIALLKGVNEGNQLKIRVDKVEPLRSELLDFVRAAGEGRPPMVTGQDGLHALALARALLVSGARRQVLPVSAMEAIGAGP